MLSPRSLPLCGSRLARYGEAIGETTMPVRIFPVGASWVMVLEVANPASAVEQPASMIASAATEAVSIGNFIRFTGENWVADIACRGGAGARGARPGRQ